MLLIGYEDEHSVSNVVGKGGDVLALMLKALEHALSCHPDDLETKLRAKIAQIILGGGDHAAE